MKRILALALSAALALVLLSSCQSPDAQATVVLGSPAEGTESVPTPPAPAATHHPEETHHLEPEPTHHPEETHHLEPAPTHHPEDDHHDAAAPAPEPIPDAGVDLAAFYANVTGQYEFGFLELASEELLDGYYSGLTGIDTLQCLVYICTISMNNGEFGLVQVRNSEDVDGVKAVFQARIDYMAGDGNGPGGAQYPMAMDQWENNSRVVSNGNYVMMVVHENCEQIVEQFNALF